MPDADDQARPTGAGTTPAVKSADVELFRRYRATGDRNLRNELVEANRALADYHVRRYAQRGQPEDDLRQVALLAILRAVERFDPDLGVSFSTFANRTIDGELKRYLRDRTWSVRPPRRAQELHLEVRRADEELTQRLGRSPTVLELASELGANVDHVLEAFEVSGARRASSLDQPAGDEEFTRAERLGQVEPGFGVIDHRLLVSDLLDTLDERDRFIIQRRFFDNCSQEEIARELGVSQSYLSRVLRRILLQLRHELEVT
ncbi:sigma-70 family RNA polymerase sigma factor [Rhabdothermincola sp.]|uniref:sigma-70 family RNA polymerase sigma factor n=1 Tax=Rhabdothermincola sp. TaxID=2820405 RepID=UPI002FE26ED9